MLEHCRPRGGCEGTWRSSSAHLRHACHTEFTRHSSQFPRSPATSTDSHQRPTDRLAISIRAISDRPVTALCITTLEQSLQSPCMHERSSFRASCKTADITAAYVIGIELLRKTRSSKRVHATPAVSCTAVVKCFSQSRSTHCICICLQ